VRAARRAVWAVGVKPTRALNYFGSKVQSAHRYPAPRHATIVEPFCGGAGYSLCHRTHAVELRDVNPDVVGAWRYLIETPSAEIMRLPLLAPGESVPSDLEPGARLLIGWNVGMNGARPQGNLVPCSARVPSSFWGESKRRNLAALADQIRHWRVTLGSYEEAPDIEATWFVDGPYFGRVGAHYPHGSEAINFRHLAEWCRSRRGQVIVCEGVGAEWLPFEAHHVHASAPTHDRPGRRRSTEVLWLGGSS
jgi:hypothetical protein